MKEIKDWEKLDKEMITLLPDCDKELIDEYIQETLEKQKSEIIKEIEYIARINDNHETQMHHNEDIELSNMTSKYLYSLISKIKSN